MIKKKLLLPLFVALMGVGTITMSTLAWFQIESQPLKTDLVSADPNITINNVDGIKKEEVIDPTTGDYGVSDLITRKSYTNNTTNTDIGTVDTNFDIPKDGVGYYLLRQNPSGTYNFVYTENIKYSAILLNQDYSTPNRCYADLTGTYAVDNNDSFIIKYYTFENNKTVVKQIDINSAYPASPATALNNNDKSVIVTTGGSYRVWFDYSAKSISFEDISSPIEDKNKPQQLANPQINSGVERKSRRNASTSTTIYYAVPAEYVSSGYSLQSNFNKGWGGEPGGGWASASMTDTGKTYNGYKIYTCTFNDYNGGLDELQLQRLKNGSWNDQVVAFSGWKTVGDYNGKMYVRTTSEGVVLRDHVNDASVTLYYAINTSYTVKVNYQSSYSSQWTQSNMVKTAYTYNGMPIYSYTGNMYDIDKLQVQTYSGSTQKSSTEVISSHTLASSFSNKMVVGSSLVDYMRDGTAASNQTIYFNNTDYTNVYQWNGNIMYTPPFPGVSLTKSDSDLFKHVSVGDTTSSLIFNKGNSDGQVQITYDSSNPFYTTSGSANITNAVSFKYSTSQTPYLDNYFTYDSANRKFSLSSNIYMASGSLFYFEALNVSNNYRNGVIDFHGDIVADAGFGFFGQADYISSSRESGNGHFCFKTTAPGYWNFDISADAFGVYKHVQYGITASFTPIYNVTLNKQNGSGGDSNIYELYNNGFYKNESCTTQMTTGNNKITTPTRSGYEFGGYYTGTSGSGVQYINENGFITSSASASFFEDNGSLYANWTPAAYDIILNTNGGNINSGNVTSYTYGTGATLPTDVTKTGYDFDGWWTNEACTVGYTTVISASATGNKEYWAKWTPTSYTITYILNGGTASNPTSYTIESSSITLNNPTKTGYTFAGWTGDGSGMSVTISTGSTGNKSYTATWTKNTYTVQYNGNKPAGATGTVTSLPADGTWTYDENGTLGSAPLLTGWTFDGWYLESECSNKVGDANETLTTPNLVSSGSVTLHAKWIAKTTTVSFNVNGGTGTLPDNVTATYDSTMLVLTNFEVLEKTGYTFGGYYDTSASTGGTQFYNASGVATANKWNHIDANFVLYARWIANTYTVYLDDNGGSGGSGSVTVTYDQDMPTPLTAPTRSNYTFGGYYTSNDSGETLLVQYYTGGNTPSSAKKWTLDENNVTLYAYWTANYTVDYTLNGGTAGSKKPTSFTYGTAQEISRPTKAGYAFVGWTISSGDGQCGKTSETDVVITDNITKYGANEASYFFTDLSNTAGSTVRLTANWVSLTKIKLTLNGGSWPSYLNITTYGGDYCIWYAVDSESVYYYLDRDATMLMTTNTNSIFDKTKATWWPTNSSKEFEGFAKGSQNGLYIDYVSRPYIDEGGYITEYAMLSQSVALLPTNNGYSNELFMIWAGSERTITLDANTGSFGDGVNNKLYSGDDHSKWGIYFETKTSKGSYYLYSKKVTENVKISDSLIPTASSTYGAASYGKVFGGYTKTKNGSDLVIDSYGYLTNNAIGGFNNSGVPTSAIYYFNGNGTLYALWIDVVTITLNPNSGSGDYTPAFYEKPGHSGEAGFYFNSNKTNPISLENSGFSLPTRSGYRFAGYWSSDNTIEYIDYLGNFTSVIADATYPYETFSVNTILYAKWEQIYEVNIRVDGNIVDEKFYHVNDGAYYLDAAGTQKMEVYSGVEGYHVTPRSKTGYTFTGFEGDGWLDGGTMYLDARGYITQYAVDNPSNLNHRFALGSSTVKAVFEENIIQVTYNANGGTGSIAGKTYRFTQDHSLPNKSSSTITRAGYTLFGWGTSDDATTYDAFSAFLDSDYLYFETSDPRTRVTLYAVWVPNVVRVTYNGNGSTSGSMSPNPHDYAYTDNNWTLDSCGFVKTGYLFAEWNTQANGSGDSLSALIASDFSDELVLLPLYAIWTPIHYTVQYRGDTISIDNYYAEYDDANSVTKPSRTGYTFNGWIVSTGQGLWGDNTEDPTNVINSTSTPYGGSASAFSYMNLTPTDGNIVTLTASWTAHTYTVTLISNNGAATSSVLNGTYDQELDLPLNEFVKDGWNFAGWGRDADQLSVDYEDEAELTNNELYPGSNNANVNLYALWSTTITVYDPTMKFTKSQMLIHSTGGGASVTYHSMTKTTDNTGIYYSYEGIIPGRHVQMRFIDNQVPTVYSSYVNYSDKNAYYALTSINGSTFGGRWASAILSPSVSTYTVNAFDGSTGKTAINNANNVYAYAWNSTWSAGEDGDPVKQFTSGFQTVAKSEDTGISYQNIYAATISVDYDSFGFFDANNLSSPWTLTNLSESTFYSNSEYLKRYYVVNTLTSHRYEGTAYFSILSTHTNTYYFNDHKNDKWASVVVLASVSGDCFVGNGYGSADYYVGTGKPMNQTNLPVILENLADDTWKIEISETYDSIIFWDGVNDADAYKTTSVATSGNNNKYYVLTGAQNNLENWLGAWTSTIYTVNFEAVYFIDSTKSTISSSALPTTSEKAFDVYKYTPEFVPDTGYYQLYADDTNKIVYCFMRDTFTSNWYTDEACSSAYSEGAAALTGNITLYTKLVANMSKHRTFYVDNKAVSDPWGDTVKVVINGQGADHDYFSLAKVANNLYRVTLPAMDEIWDDGLIVKFHKDNPGDNTYNWSVLFDPQDYTNLSVITINSAIGDGSNRTISGYARVTLNADDREGYGYTTIQVSNDGITWTDIPGAVMSNAAGSNKYVFELGAQIDEGKYIRIANWASKAAHDTPTSPTTTYEYAQYDVSGDDNNGLPHFLTKVGNHITIAEDTGTQLYNFYVIANGKFAVAMVPNLGNGYYIIPYVASNGTNSYINAKKMSSSSDYSAFYNGFHATNSSQFFIRSYINAVDTLYADGVGSRNGSNIVLYSSDSNATTDDITLNITTGVITFGSGAGGHYNITVENNKIGIVKYEALEFFKLNTLNTSNTSSGEAINSQSTGLILEVAFTSTNLYPSKVFVEVENGLKDYVGVALAVVRTAPLSDSDAYALLNTKRSTLSNESLIAGKNTNDSNDYTIAANDPATHYAYILIDYLPGVDYSAFASKYSGNFLSFYLRTESF